MTVRSGLRDYLRRQAGWVWRKQARAFSYGLSLQEETLTEMLLLRMTKDHASHGLAVTIFNKHEEGLNGADWEWILRTPSCEICLRVQAKRLYHSATGKEYGGLDPASTQVDKLITQAGSSIPVYVFYNHPFGKNSDLFHEGGEAPYRGQSFWGCAIAGAHAVKIANSNSLRVLHQIIKPWHHLVTDRGTCGIAASLGIPANELTETMAASRLEVVERIRDTNFMQQYLRERDLAGAAVVDFRHYRSD